MSQKADGDYYRHECNRCDHIWYSMNFGPGVCVRCKSPYWNRSRKRKVRA